MELEPEEKALVDYYREQSEGPKKAWVLVLVLGVIICAAALVLLFVAEGSLSGLLALMAGLVVIARSLDDRKKVLLSRIMQKYDRALREMEPESN